MSKALTIHIDGAARGNPGPAAYAFVISQDGKPVVEDSGCLGRTTNNQAEYTALVRALEKAAQLGGKRLLIHSDSELLVRQMNGQYQVKNADLRLLFNEAKELSRQFDTVTLKHVPRAQNAHADRLCNEALDGAGPKPAGVGRAQVGAGVEAQVRAEAVTCLQSAAEAWARGGQPAKPDPEMVWDQLWSILEEHGVVKARK